MSIFGKIDAETIPSSPFFVEKGEYEAEVVKAEFRKKRSDDSPQLFIEYSITSEESSFNGSHVQQYLPLPDPDLTNEAIAILPPQEQKNIRRNLSNIKRALCGNDGYSNQPGLGVPADDLNDKDWNPVVLVGKKVIVAVNNFGPSNTGVGVQWANLREE